MRPRPRPLTTTGSHAKREGSDTILCGTRRSRRSPTSGASSCGYRGSARTLKRRWPELFAKEVQESDQNSYWYKHIYGPARDAPQVLQAHGSFLLYRDALAGLTVLFVGLLGWRVAASYWPVQHPTTWVLVLLLVSFVVGQAARPSGHRMVTNAVAARLLVESSVSGVILPTTMMQAFSSTDGCTYGH